MSFMKILYGFVILTCLCALLGVLFIDNLLICGILIHNFFVCLTGYYANLFILKNIDKLKKDRVE